jgi:hypothetical protein
MHEATWVGFSNLPWAWWNRLLDIIKLKKQNKLLKRQEQALQMSCVDEFWAFFSEKIVIFCSQISWSGCKDSQTSADSEEAGKATGAMSFVSIFTDFKPFLAHDHS